MRGCRWVNTKIYSPLSHSLKKLTRGVWSERDFWVITTRCVGWEEKKADPFPQVNFFSSFFRLERQTHKYIHMQHRTYLLLEVDSDTIYAVEFCLMWVASLDLAREFFAWNLTWAYLACSMAWFLYNCSPSNTNIPCNSTTVDPMAILTHQIKQKVEE